jgi:hypothetical protein
MKATLLVAAVLLASVAFAQSTGTIAGIILTVAGAGAAVPKAQVHANNVATGVSYSAQSAANGNYTVTGLAPGTYELSVTNPPLFVPFSRKDIQVQAGQTVRIDIRLDDSQLSTLGDGGEQFAQLIGDQPARSGRTPRTRDGKPDLSGAWMPSIPTPLGEMPELLPWADELTKQRRGNLGIDSPSVHCLPLGVSHSGVFVPYRLVQTQRLLAIISENGDPPRQIYLDGRGHPKDPNPSYMGHSAGRWEGDTLVVDSVGFNDRTWLAGSSYPQTEQMHVVERFRRPDLGHLEVEVTFDDPGTFKKPWKTKRVNSLAPNDFEVLENVCNENNRDLGHLVGK